MTYDATEGRILNRIQPEWAAHAGTWFSWPHNPDTWPGNTLARTEAILADAVRALLEGEAVHLNVRDAAHEAHVRARLGDAADRVHFHHIPTDDAWCRDHGALFLTPPDGPGLVALEGGFNAWGGKYPPFDQDARVARRMAEALGVPCRRTDFILEGGALDFNGAGVLLTTASCLLNPNRNPGLTRAAAEAHLRTLFGLQQIYWLEGDLEGDDTDGHIDNLARFVAEGTVLAAYTPDPADPNHAALAANLARLRTAILPDGRPLRVETLPMPDPVYYEGRRLPASYANFYIGNAVVLLPTYGGSKDAEAAALLAKHFPTRRIVGLDGRSVVVGLGAFHCLTQQIPLVNGDASPRYPSG